MRLFRTQRRKKRERHNRERQAGHAEAVEHCVVVQKGTERIQTPRRHRNARRGGRESKERRTLCLVSPQFIARVRGVIGLCLARSDMSLRECANGASARPMPLRRAHLALHRRDENHPRKTKTGLPSEERTRLEDEKNEETTQRPTPSRLINVQVWKAVGPKASSFSKASLRTVRQHNLFCHHRPRQ